AKDAPPWPIIIERLREASSGERGRFLMRSAFIYSLAASGELARARADLESLGQLAGGKDAPLYGELHDFLERLGAFDKQAEENPAEEKPVEERPADLEATQVVSSAERVLEEPPPTPEKTAKDASNEAVPAKPKVPAK